MPPAQAPSSSPFPVGSLVAFYARDSGGIEQGASTEQQIDYARKWADENGVTITRVFTDAARTGKKVVGRAQFLAMVDYFSQGEIPERGIALYEFSRFGRQFDDVTFYLADLRRQGYIVHSLVDNVPDTLNGRLFETILHWKNAKYSLELGQNVTRAILYNARTYHAYHSNRPPAGYRKVAREIGAHRDGKPHIISILEPDPESRERVIRAFTLRAEGRSLQEIHDVTHLHSCRAAYARMLRNRIYLGEYTIKGEIIPGFCEPLVSPELFAAVQDTLTSKGNVRPASIYLLTGLLRCVACNSLANGTTVIQKGHTYRYYLCNRRGHAFPPCAQRGGIPAAEIEHRVIERLKEYLSDPDIVERVCREAETMIREARIDTDSHLAEKRAELKVVNGAIGHILSAIREIGHSRALLADLKEQEERQLELEQEIQEIESKEHHRIDRLPGEGEIRAIYNETLRKLENASARELKLILRAYIKEIRAGKDGGIIVFITPVGTEITVEL